MMTIGDRIKLRRKQLKISAVELGRRLGKDRSTIYRYENGDIGNFPTEVLVPLSDILQTTPAYLMGWEDSPDKRASNTVPFNVLPIPEMKQIPMLGKIACGEPILAEENFDGYVNIPTNIDADFSLTCQGDSMINARILDGDIVCVRSQPEVENGEIAAVLIDGEATLKRVYWQDDMLTLSPENSAYKPFTYAGKALESVRIMGKAVAFISMIR